MTASSSTPAATCSTRTLMGSSPVSVSIHVSRPSSASNAKFTAPARDESGAERGGGGARRSSLVADPFCIAARAVAPLPPSALPDPSLHSVAMMNGECARSSVFW